MGVINMAHGELLMMIGAYATYVVQGTCSAKYLPGAFDCLPALAIPAFLVALGAGGRGAGAQRDPLAFYGRPLETLLATWGISLMLMQGGAQPLRRAERGGGEPGLDERRRAADANLTLPYNRIAIIGLRRAGAARAWR